MNIYNCQIHSGTIDTNPPAFEVTLICNLLSFFVIIKEMYNFVDLICGLLSFSITMYTIFLCFGFVACFENVSWCWSFHANTSIYELKVLHIHVHYLQNVMVLIIPRKYKYPWIFMYTTYFGVVLYTSIFGDSMSIGDHDLFCGTTWEKLVFSATRICRALTILIQERNTKMMMSIMIF